ncbi:hypothetical protein FACS1894196_2260 [Clostridia bacterium]|nr:hypothetical protein FACS1894196_2260 [Clostridia bacterium]
MGTLIVGFLLLCVMAAAMRRTGTIALPVVLFMTERRAGRLWTPRAGARRRARRDSAQGRAGGAAVAEKYSCAEGGFP